MLLCQFVRSNRRQSLQCYLRGIPSEQPDFAEMIARADSHELDLALR